MKYSFKCWFRVLFYFFKQDFISFISFNYRVFLCLFTKTMPNFVNSFIIILKCINKHKYIDQIKYHLWTSPLLFSSSLQNYIHKPLNYLPTPLYTSIGTVGSIPKLQTTRICQCPCKDTACDVPILWWLPRADDICNSK